jgi:hypothetical protein
MAHPFSPGKLSLELEQLQRRVEGRSLTVSELEQLLKGRGAALLLILLALPFCFIAIPGLSTPFGIAIGLIGLSLLIGRDPRLPGFITQRRLPAARLAQILSCSISVARQLEKFARPRFAILYDGPVRLRLIGLGIVVASGGLMLPLPIPFSNSIPAWAVVLLTVGMLEKDGLCVLLGHLTAVGSWVFIGVTSIFAAGSLQKILELFPAL